MLHMGSRGTHHPRNGSCRGTCGLSVRDPIEGSRLRGKAFAGGVPLSGRGIYVRRSPSVWNCSLSGPGDYIQRNQRSFRRKCFVSESPWQAAKPWLKIRIREM
jgi:hypothetical protein